MGNPSDLHDEQYAPVGGGTFPRAADIISGTGTTEDSNATALNVGSYATLLVGASSVRVSFRKLTAQPDQVATTAPLLPAGAKFDWFVTDDTKVLYAQAGDGASAYEAWLWQSSP